MTQYSEVKLWEEMTPEEKGALLLAYLEGEQIEMDCSPVRGRPKWVVEVFPTWIPTCAYRIKPAEPVVEVVEIYGSKSYGHWAFGGKEDDDTHKITLTIRDGVVDPIAQVEEL